MTFYVITIMQESHFSQVSLETGRVWLPLWTLTIKIQTWTCSLADKLLLFCRLVVNLTNQEHINLLLSACQIKSLLFSVFLWNFRVFSVMSTQYRFLRKICWSNIWRKFFFMLVLLHLSLQMLLQQGIVVCLWYNTWPFTHFASLRRD